MFSGKSRTFQEGRLAWSEPQLRLDAPAVYTQDQGCPNWDAGSLKMWADWDLTAAGITAQNGAELAVREPLGEATGSRTPGLGSAVWMREPRQRPPARERQEQNSGLWILTPVLYPVRDVFSPLH